eukprot:SAG31_NODE_3078_length_4708_cov_1.870471_5_plen_72_part_00
MNLRSEPDLSLASVKLISLHSCVRPKDRVQGRVVVCSAGTADLPVAQEVRAIITAIKILKMADPNGPVVQR